MKSRVARARAELAVLLDGEPSAIDDNIAQQLAARSR
jgi:hypothetical protein